MALEIHAGDVTSWRPVRSVEWKYNSVRLKLALPNTFVPLNSSSVLCFVSGINVEVKTPSSL